MSNVKGEFDVAYTESRDHRHGRKQSSRKPGDLRNIQLFEVGSVGDGEMPHCQRASLWEVRQSRSTEEVGEQCWKANGSGVYGGGNQHRETDVNVTTIGRALISSIRRFVASW